MNVDVHILRVSGERNDWYGECCDSLDGEPVVVHVVQGVEGHIGLGRQKGLALGSNPYVALVDPDDRVRPGAFQACIDGLEANPLCVMAYTREASINPEGRVYDTKTPEYYERFVGTPAEVFSSHHLAVFRRSALPDLAFLADWPYGSEFELKRRMFENNFLFVPVVGYERRHRPHDQTFAMQNLPAHCQDLLRQRIDLLYGSNS